MSNKNEETKEIQHHKQIEESQPAVQKQKSQAEFLLDEVQSKSVRFVRDETGEAFALVDQSGHTVVKRVNGKEFKTWLNKVFFDATRKPLSVDSRNQALSVMEMWATYEGEQRRLHRRVAVHNGEIYYDLGDENWQTVVVSKHGCRIVHQSEVLFKRNKNMKAQVIPDFENGDLTLLAKHVRFKNEEDLLLFLVYVVACFVPGFPHAVLVLAGEKGAAKSTIMKMIREIVDPAHHPLLTMQNGIQDLVLVLANNYVAAFDNLDTLSAEKSDLLCMASTGGSHSKRMLYSDDDQVLLNIMCIVILNGIHVVSTRPDLVDRSKIVELNRINESDRKEEREVWECFNHDLPRILGGVLNVLAKTLTIYPEVKLKKLHRMADYTRWGFAIAEAAGLSGERFLIAYENNRAKANENAIYSHPVAATVVKLMHGCAEWQSTVAELLQTLSQVAEEELIDTNVKVWPRSPHVLSMRLDEVKSNLMQVGISFHIRNIGTSKLVTIINKAH